MQPSVSELLTPVDPAVVGAMLAPTVTFHSPVADYHGRDDIAHLLTIIGRCLDGIETHAEYAAGSRAASEFTATVGGDAIDGVLVRQLDAGGMVEEVTLLLRPMRSLHAAVTLMRDALIEEPLPSTRGRAR